MSASARGDGSASVRAPCANRAREGIVSCITSLRSFAGGGSLLFLIGAACTVPRVVSHPWFQEARPARSSAPGAAPAPREAAEPPESEEAEEDSEAAEPRELLDTWSLAAREDGDTCVEDLKAAGFKFRAYPEKTEPNKKGCGMPHGVVVFRGPTRITYSPPITVDCSLARALGSVERIVQEEAERHLGSPIVKIKNLGGFACRTRNTRSRSSLSAHAFGSALDVSAFQPKKGAAAVIVRDYAESKRTSRSREARRDFLHAVYSRLRHHEADLTYVVGPDFNAKHRNHFHLDRGGWAFWFSR